MSFTLPNWLAHVYAIVMLIITPVVAFYIMPLSMLDTFYLASRSAYALVCVWFTAETLSALSTLRTKVEKIDHPRRSITYILPAYLDNESVVLDDTIAAFCNLKFTGTIQVMVVYNTKRDDPEAEKALHSKWDDTYHGKELNISVKIVKNDNSTSKAENVNYGLTLIPDTMDYVAIFDADHHPMPNNAGVAITTMEKNNFDILQGTCTIRNQDNFLSTLVSVEFEDMYCVSHQGRLAMFNLGIFGGSNGYWKGGVIKEIKMDGEMLTEDIDSSVRSTLKGYRIGFCRDVISSELAPVHRLTLEKQRLRWAQGWAQVSAKYVGKCLMSTKLTLRQKIGIVYLLSWREVFTYLTFWPILCVFAYFHRRRGGYTDNSVIATSIAVFILGVVRIIVTYLMSMGPIRRNKWAFLRFAICNLGYAAYLNYVQISAHGRAILKMDNWVATVRERTNNTESSVHNGV